MRFISSEIDRRDLAGSGPLKINILGMAFKGLPETSDLRGSMSIKVLDALKKAHPNAEIGVYDPVTSRGCAGGGVPRRDACSTGSATRSAARRWW